jgi:hypothetical protein
MNLMKLDGSSCVLRNTGSYLNAIFGTFQEAREIIIFIFMLKAQEYLRRSLKAYSAKLLSQKLPKQRL